MFENKNKCLRTYFFCWSANTFLFSNIFFFEIKTKKTKFLNIYFFWSANTFLFTSIFSLVREHLFVLLHLFFCSRDKFLFCSRTCFGLRTLFLVRKHLSVQRTPFWSRTPFFHSKKPFFCSRTAVREQNGFSNVLEQATHDQAGSTT